MTMTDEQIEDVCVVFAEIAGDYAHRGPDAVEERLREEIAERQLSADDLEKVFFHPVMFSGDGWGVEDMNLIAKVCGVKGHAEVVWKVDSQGVCHTEE